MALWVEIRNDATGDEQIGHYDVTVGLNKEVLWRGRIEHFKRAIGWRGLLWRVAIQALAHRDPDRKERAERARIPEPEAETSRRLGDAP